jgi:capping protein (actin filament) muscle Z-line, alpha
LDKILEEYVGNYYPNGVSAVFITEQGYSCYIVGNKYNPSNFWLVVITRAGRWREIVTLPFDLSSFHLEIKVQVHYYEDGNVQLNSSQTYAGNVDGGVNSVNKRISMVK